ncbi:MAG: hypothetical protein QNK37_27265 [Acidobacteriota bacterium]|nr:hypothetical protein [Acidobacteriota bacterium]
MITLLLSGFLMQGIDFWTESAYRVNYVNLDVVVLDKRGEPVRDLTQDDFAVKDGRTQVYPNLFRRLDLDDPKAAPKRAVTIIMELDAVSPAEAGQMFQQLQQFLESRPETLPFQCDLVSLSGGSLTGGYAESRSRALTVLAAFRESWFRQNKDRGRFAGSKSATPAGATTARRRTYSLLGPAPNNLRTLERALQAASSATYNRSTFINGTLNAFMEEMRQRSNNIVNRLDNLAQAKADEAGLKTFIFLSNGFALTAPASAYAIANRVGSFSSGRGVRKAGDANYRPEGRGFDGQRPNMPAYSIHRFDHNFERLFNLAVRNRITFHAVNLSRDPTGDFEREMGIPLNEISVKSGGIYAAGDQPAKYIEDALEKSRYIYLLGYRAPSAKPGRYHKIKVKCRERKTELLHRDGYYGSY